MNRVLDRDLKGYFGWLLKICGVFNEVKLHDLMYQLHQMEFSWSIGTDKNRSFDGLKIRSRYFGEKLLDRVKDGKFECGEGEVPGDGSDILGEDLMVPCSVLEFLIGLAKRVSNDLIGNDGTKEGETEGIKRWILLMLTNLGVLKNGVVVMKKGDICSSLEVWMSRRFGENGVGSPFPLSKNESKIDQRKVEIWQQLALYLYEHPELEEE